MHSKGGRPLGGGHLCVSRGHAPPLPAPQDMLIVGALPSGTCSFLGVTTGHAHFWASPRDMLIVGALPSGTCSFLAVTSGHMGIVSSLGTERWTCLVAGRWCIALSTGTLLPRQLYQGHAHSWSSPLGTCSFLGLGDLWALCPVLAPSEGHVQRQEEQRVLPGRRATGVCARCGRRGILDGGSPLSPHFAG